MNLSLGEEEFREWVARDTRVQRMLLSFQSVLRAENTSGQTANSNTVQTKVTHKRTDLRLLVDLRNWGTVNLL